MQVIKVPAPCSTFSNILLRDFEPEGDHYIRFVPRSGVGEVSANATTTAVNYTSGAGAATAILIDHL